MIAIIIDQALGAQEALSKLLRTRCPDIQIAGQATEIEVASILIQQAQPDLVFCEATAFNSEDKGLRGALAMADTALIIMGNTDKHAVLAFELKADAYLQQPVNPIQLVRAVQNVQKKRWLHTAYLEQEWIRSTLKKLEVQDLYQRRFSFSNKQETFFIYLKDLIRIEASNNCSYVYAIECPNGVFISKNLGEFLQAFRDVPFLFQPHRSHLVNLLHIQKVVKKDGGIALVLMQSDGTNTLIPVAQQCKEKLNLRLKELWPT